MNVPNATPLVYELDDSLKKIRSYYLEDPEIIQQKMNDITKHNPKDVFFIFYLI